MKKKRVIAIYLPQYHPVIENDKWWGKGFTEWTNVTKAKPLFRNHYQPHLPSDLGFYDLRVPETREQQANIAKAHGIDGFCYYHYWFNGKRVLERPFNEVIESGKPNFPFMLCWANENWTRAWDGGEKEILLEQKYSEEDDRNHIKYLLSIFKDERYIKIDGKPIFCIYRSTVFPNMKRTINVWREEAAKVGMNLYLCRMESFACSGPELLKDGFDAAIDFQPLGKSMIEFGKQRHLWIRIVNKINTYIFNTKKDRIVDYKKYVDYMCNYPQDNYKIYPCVTPMWDNTPRRQKNRFIMKNSSPQFYKKWLLSVFSKFNPFSEQENLIFINAWNEWAEGNHLEPDSKWGRMYLEATKEVVEDANKIIE